MQITGCIDSHNSDNSDKRRNFNRKLEINHVVNADILPLFQEDIMRDEFSDGTCYTLFEKNWDED